jgi:mono/diheme cytochrome c family protein
MNGPVLVNAFQKLRVRVAVLFPTPPALLTLVTVLVLAGQASAPVSAQVSDAFGAQFRRFADTHCGECHGPDVQKAKLRLDTLPATFNDKDTAATWVKVLDKLAHGQMPPPKSPRPSAKDVTAVTSELNRHLLAASLARQQRDGRVVLRRLNRTEYQTVLRDLLGGAVEVKDLLPEDNVAAGFDNVSAVLDISSTHLLRYQDAAERALQTVIPNRPPTPFTERRTGRQISEKATHFKDLLGKSVRVDGDALVMLSLIHI